MSNAATGVDDFRYSAAKLVKGVADKLRMSTVRPPTVQIPIGAHKVLDFA